MSSPENRSYNEGDREPLEMRQELVHDNLIPLQLSAVQSVQIMDKVRGLMLMLTSKNNDKEQLSISIPSDLAEIYQMILTGYYNEGVGVEVDLVDYLLVPFDIHFSKLIILNGGVAGIECWLSTFSIREGEVTYFRLPPHVAILYAVQKHLSIECEESVLGKASIGREPEGTTLKEYLVNSDGRLPSESEREQFSEWLHSHSVQELEELKEIAVNREWYEWALWLSEVIDDKNRGRV